MDYAHALILSVIEGLTEFLPISSTGHLILASKIMSLAQTDYLKSFEISIQFGAILSIVVLYFRTFTRNIKVLTQIAIAFVPTAIVGFILYKLIKKFLIGNVEVTLAALFIGAIVIILAEKYFKNHEPKITKIEELKPMQSVLIGLAQSLAVIPGVSRSAATILSAMGLGLSREASVEFSFLLAVPTMAAATGYDLLKSASTFTTNQLDILAFGFVASFIAAIIAVKWFVSFIKTNTLIPFGIYRIIIAILFILLWR